MAEPKAMAAKAADGNNRSALSDFTPSYGPGGILTVRSRDSLRRCYRATVALFRSRQAEFSAFDWAHVRRHLGPAVLNDVVRWYWYAYDHDRRTKGSDLKRELAKVVTHLDPLVAAMGAVPPASRRVLNRLLSPPTRERPEPLDLFSQAEQLNALLLEHCGPLVEPKFVKQPSTSAERACAALIPIWENISQQQFDRNTKAEKSGRGTVLITDNYVFESDGMHFLHVMLQAIDPTITYSRVRTAIRRQAAPARSTIV
jgi:hypothetical protein